MNNISYYDNTTETIAKEFEKVKLQKKIIEKINQGMVLDEIMDYIFSSFQILIPYERIGVAFLEGSSVTSKWVKSKLSKILLKPGYKSQLKGSSLENIINTGKPRIINNLKKYLVDNPSSGSTKLIVEEGMLSNLTCPLIVKGKPAGFLFFTAKEANTYKDLHADIFSEIAGSVSIIVEKGRLYQEIIELNEMKNKFLGIVAHDIRSPVLVVKNYLELFNLGFLGNITDEQGEILADIDKMCHTMLCLIDDLLDLSVIQSGKWKLRKKKTCISSYLTGWYSLNKVLGKAKNIEVSLEIGEDITDIFMDPNRINQVLTNLLTNAIKFSHSGTAIKIIAVHEDNHLKISVCDNGQGIPEEEMKYLFNELSRTSVLATEGEKCTGLGLSICKCIVNAHGGEISVKSKEGKGTVFTFTIPVNGEA
ncbi:MAG: GAF domain-containing sensor histidine kinase [Candidatus Eremiobacterota bacterium]